jgi:hypothetical protein
MLLPHVYCSCWTVWSGFAIFPLEVSTQSPLPNSCLEYGGLQCSHISIIHCVFYCFIVFIHGLFHFLVPFNLFFLFISFHSCSFIFMSFPFFSFLVISFHFFFFFLFPFFLEKTITNLNHLHVDPRLSSAAKPVISAKSIPTAPMDPISCPANHIWRYPKCAEVCRSVPKCAEVLTFVESTCLQCLPNHSQRNGSHRKGPVLHWAIQLYWMSILNLFTSSLSSSVLGKPWHRS